MNTMVKRTAGIQIGALNLKGFLVVPRKASGMVLFVHGSGSSRFSPRNRYVAKVLQDAGMATLLIDLLTEGEDATQAKRFDINLLTNRLISIIEWLKGNPATAALPLGLFGASTGAAAALKAAAHLGPRVKAVVSRGGRPDLAMDEIPRVTTPTLLIVGGEDPEVITLNEQALRALRSLKQLEIIRGATHLFEEPGTLERAAELARSWFKKYLSAV